MRAWPILAILLLASCKAKKDAETNTVEKPRQETTETKSGAQKIPGGSAQSYRGISFDLPKGWSAAPVPNDLLPGAKSLTPEGANPGGAIEEAYVLIGDPAISSIDGADFQQRVEKLLAAAQPGLERQGAGEKRKFGDLGGRVLRYAGKSEDGRKVEARVFGFLGDCACALVVLGLADAVSKRDADIAAILGSMSKAAPTGGAPAEELVGQWAWITDFNANTGGGRTTSKVLTLRADGTYEFHAESDSSGSGEGFHWSAGSTESDGGSWTATATTITFKSRSGGEKSYALEKRNHPKNVHDPMIVLDGQPFVTTTRREPW